MARVPIGNNVRAMSDDPERLRIAELLETLEELPFEDREAFLSSLPDEDRDAVLDAELEAEEAALPDEDEAREE